MNDAQPNRDQATYWNQDGGPRWVAMERALDAQLAPFGPAVANKLEVGPGQRVLDVGCGGGATSLMLAERAKPGQVVGLDISGPLLERARVRAAGIENLRFEQADAQTFAFTNASYDAVFSRFGVMFFADPIAAFQNLRSALRVGGKLGFVCWRSADENAAFGLPLKAALPFLPQPPEPPAPGAPGPFAFADERRLRGVLEQAGYVDIDVARFDVVLSYAGNGDLEAAVELALQVGPLSRLLAALPGPADPRIRGAVREALRSHHGPTGVTFPAATWIATARRPVAG